MKLIGTHGPYFTVELSPTDALALIDAVEEVTSTCEHRPFAQALRAALHAMLLHAWRAENRDGADGDYSEAALREAWGIKEVGK